MDVFDLVAKITLDSSEYEKGLGDAEKSAQKWGDGLSKASSVAKGVGVAMTAITAATVAAGGAFISGASSVAEYGDKIDKMSQKMGISAQAYQEWDAILQHSGSSIDSMARGMQTLQKNAVNSADKFKKLGISQEQIAKMSTEELFSATIKGLQEMGEGAERTALASELLGTSAKELGPLLNSTAEETEAMRQRVHELGGVMSDEAVEASARFEDSLQDMQTALDGIKRSMLADFLPAIADTMDGLGNLFSGNESTGLGQIQQGISGIIENMTSAIPRIVSVGSQIVSALGQAILENLPRLLEMGLQVIVQLANGISQNLPTLIPAVINIILEMVNTLASNAGMLAESAVQLMIGLAEGLINAIPVLLSAVPGIVMSLAESLLNGLRDALGPVGEFLFGKVDETGKGASDRAGYWGGQIYGGFFGGGSGTGGGSSVKENAKQGGSTLMSKVFAALDETGQEAVTKATGYNGQIYQAFLGTPSGQGGGGQTSGGGAGRADGGLKGAVVAEVDEAGQAAVEAAGGYSGEIHAAFEGGGGKTSGGGAGRGGGGMSADFYATVEQAAEGAREAAVAGGGWVSEDFVTTVASGVTQKGSVVPDAATAVMDSTKTAVDFAISGMGTSGELIPDNIAGGVTSGASTLYQSVNAAMERANAEAAASAVQAQMAGQAFDTSTAGGIRGSASTVSGAARGAVTNAISSARGATGGARAVGVSIGTGMESGILSVAQRIATAAANVVSKALEAAKARADSHSPSRVFRDEVGKMLTLGIAEGMVSKDVLNALDKSAAELTGDTVKDLETMVRAWDGVYKSYYEGLEHQNFFLELAGDTDGIIANYRKMQETLHEQKEHYLRMGVDANDSAIRDMEEQWWAYQDKIDGVYDGIAKKAEQTYDTMIDVMEHKLFLSEKQGKSPEERLALLEQLMEETHKRAEALRAQGYTDDSKEIRELQKQWWGYHDDVEDINEDIAKSVKERNDKIADAMKKSVSETADIFTELAEAAQKAYDEAFDAIMDKQKAMQDKLSGYGELYKSTTTTSGRTYVSLQDLDRQTKQLERYGEIIEELRSRGVSGSLMEDILGMGIDEGSEFGKRLLNMSEGGLNNYLASYQRKQDIAADIAARYYKPEFDALNGQSTEMTVAQQQNLEYSEEQVSLLRRIAESFEGSEGQTVQVVIDGQVIANATFDDLVMVGKQRGRDIVNVKEG